MRDHLLVLAGIVAFLLLTIGVSICAERVGASERQVEGLTYLGEFNDAKFYQGPLGHPLSGCTLAFYDLPYHFKPAVAIGCR